MTGRADRLAPWLLGALALVLRLAFGARHPTEWDSANAVMALDHFDVRQHLPHPPGYWLYEALGRAVRATTTLGGHASLLLLTALGSAATVAVVYIVGRTIGGRWLGLSASAFVLTSPFAWFYGSVVGTYGFDALADALLLLFAWRARPGSCDGVWAAAVMGLAAGLRQTTPLLLSPLALVAVARSVRSVRSALVVLGAAVASALVWLVPLAAQQPGGLAVWQSVSSRRWHDDVSATSPLFGASLRQWASNAAHAGVHALAATGPVLVLALVGWVLVRRSRPRGDDPPRNRVARGDRAVLWLAVVPPLAFTLLVFFRKPGHVLAYLPAAGLVTLLPGSRLRGRARATMSAGVAVVCLLGAQRFVSGDGVLPAHAARSSAWLHERAPDAPFRVTADAIRRVDRLADTDVSLAHRLAPTCDVLVFVWENGGRMFRLATSLLPAFRINLLHHRYDEVAGYRDRLYSPAPATVEVPPGGRAVVVLDRPLAALTALQHEGLARPLAVGTPEVWAVAPGARMVGVQLVEATGPPSAGRPWSGPAPCARAPAGPSGALALRAVAATRPR